MYSRLATFQGYGCSIVRRLWDGRGAGSYAEITDGWGPAIVSEHKALTVEFGRESRLRMIEEEDHIKCYLDGELVCKLKMGKRFTSGIASMWVVNARAHLDDFIVTGDSIPDGGPGLGKAVESVGKLATIWGDVKAEGAVAGE